MGSPAVLSAAQITPLIAASEVVPNALQLSSAVVVKESEAASGRASVTVTLRPNNVVLVLLK